jgi:hypothetical protein
MRYDFGVVSGCAQSCAEKREIIPFKPRVQGANPIFANVCDIKN